MDHRKGGMSPVLREPTVKTDRELEILLLSGGRVVGVRDSAGFIDSYCPF
jgi:hypothetical protein